MNTMTQQLGKRGARDPRDDKPWYRHRWPWLLMLGPALVVVAGVITGWIAFTRQDALVVDDYYKQGKAINADLSRDRAASALGMAVAMRYDAARGRLLASVMAAGKPYVGKVVLRLVHSTQPEKDILLQGQTGRDGTLDLPLPMLEIAHWQVQVENQQREWRLAGRWNWPRERDISLKADAAPTL